MTRQILTIDETVVQAEVEGEVLLLDVRSGTYFGLEGIGARIWEALAGGTTEDEIICTLQSEYDVDPDQLRGDVVSFLDSLRARGLIRERPEGS